MKVIGITGGVGAGKTEILTYLGKRADCRVIVADKVAHDLKKRGGVCYDRIVALLGNEIVAEDGEIDNVRMAAEIFTDKRLMGQVNGIIHPAVKEYILDEIDKERKEGKLHYLFIEAALLIEDGYTAIVDEMWYIHTDEKIRRDRLKASRGYSDKKIDDIMCQQLSEEDFYRNCCVVIDNSKSLAGTYRQIDKKLGEELCQKQ